MSEPQTIVDPEQPDQIVLDTPAAVEDTGEESAYDRDFFHQVVRDAGRWAFGVVAVEVWVLNAAKTHLFRPDHGWWIDPYAIDCGENHTFDRLTDSSREDYLEATPLAPGCGLPGALYAQIQRGNLAAAASQNNILHHSVTWREVKPIAEDPDQPYNPRMQFLAAAGLGWAAGIPFAIGSLEGLVVYMARTTANIQKLLEPMNTDYLTHATLLIGSAYALRVPRLKVEKARREYTHNTMQRVKRKLRVLRILNKPLDRFVHEESERLSSRPTPALMYEQLGETARTSIASHPQTRCTAIWKRVAQKAVTTWKKCRGSNAQPPPPFNWRQTAWSFVGTFVTLMFLTLINKTMTEKFGSEYGIVLGPFGALMTLQYGLTAAPASQPRNAILGQLFALLIAHGIGQSTQLEPWFKETLAPSLAIAMMVKCGVTHPPAGAAALLFSSGTRSWPQIGMMLVGNVVAIACATVINNLSDKRKYPTFWGFRELWNWVYGDYGKDRKKKKEK